MTAVIQRPLRGSRISSFYPVKSLPSLASLDSAFQLQEYISLLIRLDVHDVNSIVSLPGNPSARDKEKEAEASSERTGKEGEKDVEVVDKGKAEQTVDEACWIYEQLRRLAQDLSHPLITTLQQECTRASCPEMKAGEWLYLCVAHGNDGAMEHCCAIDYILHTVDSATALLNSPRTFPSRLQIPVASHRHFSSLARRLGRIFAHAYFHHREAFEQAEAESSLYARFLALTERFDLVPAEFLVIPMDGHHIGSTGDSLGLGAPPSISPRDEHQRPNEFDRSYHHHQQPQQQTRYDLNLANYHHESEHHLHTNLSERNPSPPGPSSSESSSGGIGESPSPSSRARFGRNRTGTMVFAEAEANAVTDELARSSSREREREPQKIELLEREEPEEPAALVEPVVPVEPTAPVEPAPPVEPATSIEPATSTEVKPADDLQIQPIPTAITPNNSPAQDNLSIPEPTETTTHKLPADDDVLIAEPTLIAKETPETATASQEVLTKSDDKETIPPSITTNDESPTAVPAVPAVPVTVDDITIEAPIAEKPKVETTPEPEPADPIQTEPTSEPSVEEVPADKTEPEVPMVADEHTIVSSPDMSNVATKEDKVEEKSSVAVDDIPTEVGEVVTGEEETQLSS